jgi:sialic acid synthase SpsE
MKVKIIAEIGSNHAGDMSLAKEMISAAHESGADYAKFQSWKESNLKPGPWDEKHSFFGFDTKRDFYKFSEINDENHYELLEYCNKIGINFLTSCFSNDRIEFLSSLGLKTIKLASMDSRNLDLLQSVSDNFENVIVSTGMSNKKEIHNCKEFLDRVSKNYVMMHCVSIYPTPMDKVNLKKMLYIKSLMNDGGWGISDHTIGTSFPKLAVCHNAKWIEKHFTIDQNLAGPDNKFSITPNDLSEIRSFCNDYEKMSFDDQKEVYDEELKLRPVVEGRFLGNF